MPRLTGAQQDFLKAPELANRTIRDTDVELHHLGTFHGARVGHVGRDLSHNVPEVLTPALDNGLGRVGVCVGARGDGRGEPGKVKGGVAQAKAKLVARGDSLLVKGAVVNVDAFGKVGLGEVGIDALRQ